MKTADVNAFIEIAKTLDSNSSDDVDLGDNEWTKISSVKSCGIRISVSYLAWCNRIDTKSDRID
jgi:hypothetical protein